MICFILLILLTQLEVSWLTHRYEGQRDMMYNQTFNLDQVAFASEGIKDAQQTVMQQYFFLFRIFKLSIALPIILI